MLLLIAAVLLIFIGLVHSYLGEKYLIQRLFRRDNLPVILGSVENTKRTIRFAWHITTIAWWGIAGVLVVMTLSPGKTYDAVLWMCVIVFGISGLIPLSQGGRHKSWIVFLTIAGFCAVAAIN